MGVHTQNANGHGMPYVHHVYSDKHTRAHKISPPNLSEGGLLRSPIIVHMSFLHFNL